MTDTVFAPDHHPIITSMLTIHTDNDRSWAFSPHSHKEDVEISYVYHGNFFYTCNTFLYRLQKGSFFFKNPDIVHAEYVDPDAIGSQIHIMISGIHLEGHPASCIPCTPEESVLDAGSYAPFLEALFHQLTLQNNSSVLNEQIINTILLILLELKEKHQFILPEKKQKQDAVADVRRFIDNHYREALALPDLASRFFISEYYLSRKFRQITGQSITSYITNVRIGEAQRLLVFEDMNIKQISMLCGFKDIHYFFQVFRRITGMTPTVFREFYRKEYLDSPNTEKNL